LLGLYVRHLEHAAVLGVSLEQIAAAGAHRESIDECELAYRTTGVAPPDMIARLLESEQVVLEIGLPACVLAHCVSFHRSRVAVIAAGFDDTEGNRGLAIVWGRSLRSVLSLGLTESDLVYAP
jgi:hypothetical protein